MHVTGAKAHRGARHIDGDVAAADHQYALARNIGARIGSIGVAALGQAGVAQEARIDQHAVEVVAGDRQADAFMGADGDQYRIKALLEEIIEPLYPCFQPELDTEIENVLYLAIDDRTRQAEFWHADTQHAAGDGKGFEDSDTIASAAKILGGGHTAWPGADDGDALVEAARDGLWRNPRLGVDAVGDEALESADVDRLVNLGAAARCLAAVVADAPADRGKGIVLDDGAIGVVDAALADQRDVALSALACGAGLAARGDTALLDGIGVGGRLGIQAMRRRALAEAFVKTIGDALGTDLGAFAATITGGKIDKARLGAQRGTEVARLAYKCGDLAAGENLDIEMATNLDQAR